MEKTRTRSRVVLIAVIVAASLLTPAAAPVAAEEPETADDYFTELRTMDNLDVYEEYGELETLHTQSLSAVQVGEFTSEQASELDSIIATLRLFENAQSQYEADEFAAGFETATEIESEIDTLETYDESLAALSTLALTRYYEQLGDELVAQAEATENTPTEIELREMAASAYERSNDPDQAAEYTRQVEQLNAELSADRDQMDEAEAAMASFSETCSACESPISAFDSHNVGVVTHYETSLSVTPVLADAIDRAERHGLTERQETLEAQSETARTMQLSLAVASSGVLLGYGILVAIVVAVITSRLLAWKRAFEAANVDSVVTVGDRDV